MQETEVWSLVQEDPTSMGATKAMCHNYWVCAPEAGSSNWAQELQALKPAALKPVLHGKRSHRHSEPTPHTTARQMHAEAARTQRSQK